MTSATAPAGTAGRAAEAPPALSLLRCACCGRRWLAEGDLRAGVDDPCPHCGGGVPGVLGVHC